MHVPATSHSFTWWSDNSGSWFVYLILWVLEINLRSSGWAASAFTLRAILPSHCRASHMTLPMKIVITTAVLQHYWKKKDTIFLRRISSSSSSSGSRLNHCSSVPSDYGCLEYRVNLELVLCPCLKKDCLDLEEWRVLESTKEQSRCDTQTDCQWLIQATFHSSSSSLQALANLKKKLTGHTEGKKDFPQSLGLVLCSAGDLFPLTIPRWRWGMRILQGNSSPPLGNRPSPDFSESLSRTQQGRQRLKDS